MSRDLQTGNGQNKLALWAERVSSCRNSGLRVKDWRRENGVNEQTYYKWQKKLFTMAPDAAGISVRRSHAGSHFRQYCGYRPNLRNGSGYSQRRGRGYRGNGTAGMKVMLSDFTGADRVYIACGYTDLRRGIDGLAALVQQEFQLNPFSNCLFLFCGRRRDRIKALYWEGNGFVLLYKRLESGSFQWPRKESEARSLTPQQYRWLMEGLSVDQPKAHKPVSGLEIV